VTHRLACVVAIVALCAACADDAGRVSTTSTSAAASTSTASSATAPPLETTVVGRATEDESTPVLEAGGIGIVVNASGTIVRFEFGDASLDETLAALVAALGEADEILRRDDCGEGPLEAVTWSSGLATFFADATLAGWTVRPDAVADFATVDGIGRGSTRADLTAAFAELVVTPTTLGVEWSSSPTGGISGLLSGDREADVVTTLWSGSTCIAR
jgi:hypothetical protein